MLAAATGVQVMAIANSQRIVYHAFHKSVCMHRITLQVTYEAQVQSSRWRLDSTNCKFVGQNHAWNCLLLALRSRQMLSVIDDNPMKDESVHMCHMDVLDASATYNDISKVIPDRAEIFSDFFTDTRIP